MFQLLNPETKVSGVDHQHCRGKTKRRISKVFLPDSLSFACEGLVGTSADDGEHVGPSAGSNDALQAAKEL